MSRFDALECNDDNNEEADNVACSLEYETDDNGFETTLGTPLRGEQNDLSSLHEKSHCHISPTTQMLHRTLAESSSWKRLQHIEESVSVSRSNIIKNLDWIIAYGDVINNINTADKLDAIEKYVQEARIEVMKDIVNSTQTLPEGSVDWPGICTKKKNKVRD